MLARKRLNLNGETCSPDARLCDRFDLDLLDLSASPSLKDSMRAHKNIELGFVLVSEYLRTTLVDSEESFLSMVCEAHKMAFHDDESEAPAGFRTGPVSFGSGARYQGVVAEKIREELALLFHTFKALEKYQPEEFAIKGAWFLQRFFAIHPFADGNGRTARALLAAQAWRAGLFFSTRRPSANKNDETEYVDALDQAHDHATADDLRGHEKMPLLREWILKRLHERNDRVVEEP